MNLFKKIFPRIAVTEDMIDVDQIADHGSWEAWAFYVYLRKLEAQLEYLFENNEEVSIKILEDNLWETEQIDFEMWEGSPDILIHKIIAIAEGNDLEYFTSGLMKTCNALEKEYPDLENFWY